MYKTKYSRVFRERSSGTRFRKIRGKRKRRDDAADLSPLLHLQQTIGNQAVGRLIQAKLKVSQPGDKDEQEADRVADKVLRMPESQVQRQPKDEDEKLRRQPKEDEEEKLSRQPQEEEKEEVQRVSLKRVSLKKEDEKDALQPKALAGSAPQVSSHVQSQIHSLQDRGKPLPGSERAFFEPRFGHDFSQVRIHTDRDAAETAAAVNAKAFTVGHDVAFGSGQYASATSEGRRLLAHELTHVVQQNSARQRTPTTDAKIGSENAYHILRKEKEKIEPAEKPKIDYKKAKKLNEEYATKLGWKERLAEFKPEWAVLWNSSNFDAFANEVADFQIELGYKPRNADGVLGPITWDRIRPIGEVIAAQKKVTWADSTWVCTVATMERLYTGYTRATGEKLVPKEQKSKFEIILQSMPSHMLEVDEEYRGTGAAGALVLLGKGEFVSDSDIWDNKALKPGAAIQVWKKKSDLQRLKKGKEVKSWGTAFVFVKYVGDDGMKVLHFDQIETWKKGQMEVWIAANLLSR